MSGALITFLLDRSPRERGLLALLCIFVIPLALIFGLLLPLRAAQQDALAARTEAVAMNLWVQERAGALARMRATPQTGPQPAIGMSGIEDALIETGLRSAVSDLAQDNRGQVSLRFDQVRFTRLMVWLTEMQPSWGYDLQAFVIEASPISGDVAARLTLMPQERP